MGDATRSPMVGPTETGSPPGARRALWTGLGIIAATFGIVTWLASTILDPAVLKNRLVAAVAQATGRNVTVSGPMRIRFGLTPAVTLESVSLSNPPGFSRPDMVTIDRVEVSVALLPLLERRVEVTRMTLLRPDILLESDPTGHANWVFTPPERPAAPATGTSVPGTSAPAQGKPKESFTVSISDVRIEGGLMGWRDGTTGKTVTVESPALAFTAPAAAPVHASGTLLAAGRTVAFAVDTGPLDQLRAGGAWPVTLALESEGATLKAAGRFDRPLEGRGYHFVLDGVLPDTAAYATLLARPAPGVAKAVTVHAEVGEGETSPLPVLRLLRIGAGSVDLTPLASNPLASNPLASNPLVPGIFLAPGARLENVTLSVQGAEPIRFAAHVVTSRFASDVNGTAGDLGWLLRGARGPVTVDATWKAEGASATIAGRIEAPERLTGYALDIAAEAADPAALLAGVPPGLRHIVARAHVADAPGVTTFAITSNAGDLSGEGTVVLQPRPSVTGRVTTRRLDLDVLLAKAAPAPGAMNGAASPPPPNTPAATVPASTPTPEKAGPMIADRPLPYAALRAFDADLTFTAGVIQGRGADIAGLTAGVALKNGALVVEPFSVDSGDQHLIARLTLDAGKSPVPVTAMVRAPALALKPLLALLGLPPAVTGNAEVQADLEGTGDTPHALAASLNGWVGVAVKEGQIDTRVVNRMLERVKPIQVRGGDVTELRCFAVRADVKAGIATVQPVALNTPALILEGEGSLDLGQETLLLRLRPRAKIGGTGISLPVRVSGPWRKPVTAVDISPSGGGGLVGLVLGGKDILGAAGGGDPCPGGLAHAREVPPRYDTNGR